MFSNFSLDEFCGSEFWNSNLTWYTDTPELTPCFQKTVLVWVPCLYLWVAALLDAYYILQSKERNIPWNSLNINKLLAICLLIVLKSVDLGITIYKGYKEEGQVFGVDYFSPSVKIITFVLAATLLYFNKKYGMRASGVLFFFWLLLTLAGLPQFITAIREHISSKEHVQYKFITEIVYYIITFILFILNCFADFPPRESPYTFVKTPSPESAAGFPSRLTFTWFDPLALTGFRKSLTEEDLWDLNPPDAAAEIVPKFEKYWNRTLKEKDCETKGSLSESSNNGDFRKRSKPASVLPAICLAFGPQFFCGEVLKITADILVFTSPKLLELIISFIESNEPLWKGYLYAGGLFGCATIQTLLLGQYFRLMYLVGMRIRTALTSVIYKKALRMSNAAKKDSTSGEIINLMAVDAHRFLELTTFLNMVWSAPLQIALSLYFLWGVLGPSVLAGLAGMVVLLPFTGLLATIQKKLEENQMKYNDERVKLMNEILSGIKVLKIYAWEPSFEQQVQAIRDKELSILKKTAYVNAAKSFIWTCSPFIVSLMSFGCFVLVNDTEVLDSKRAFVALSLFNILRFPLSMLPDVISQVIQAAVGIKRINKFMNCDELNLDALEHNENEPNPITIENGSFTWGGPEDAAVLRNINMEVPRGALVAVVGAVGSGKSSLLAALLAEMTKLSGRVNTTGSVAYVPQQAWIQNATLQDNILFGKPLDPRRYSEVIDVCALRPDFDVLPGGDQTEIGEKGINLSGGQKQRVSLARAVYCGADNYFLDDPLSAVDSHVGKHIFDKVIGPAGLLAGRTRVWVTHNVSYLAQTDLVVVLRDGLVSEAGSYQQLLEKKGAFADFLLHHLSDTQRTSAEELEKLKHDIESKLGSDFHRQLQRARSLVETPEVPEPAAGDQPRHGKDNAPVDINEKKEINEYNRLIEDETAGTGSVTWAVYKHYLKSIGVKPLMASLMMFLVVRLFLIGSDFWLARWSSDTAMIVNGTVDTKKRDLYLGVYGGLGIGQASATFIADLIFYLACWRAGKIIHAMLLSNILKAPLQFFEVTPVGRVLNRFSKDVGTLDSSLIWQACNTISCVFELLGSIFVISYSTPMFTSVIVPIGAVYFLLQRYFVATSRQLTRLEAISSSPIYSHFGETIAGASTIRAYGVTRRFIGESEAYVDRNQSMHYASCIADRWLGIRLETVGNLVILFASLFAVLARGTISPGLVGLSITYSLEVTMTLNWMVRMISEVESNIVAVERIKEYSDVEQEAAWIVEPSPVDASWPSAGALRLEQVSLGYRAGEPALRDVTCAVAPRDKLGIVGRTGAGKSTLTLGLFRIVEALRGRILIDGVDIASLGLHQLRARITIIPQDPVLFSGTLRTNLDPFGAHSDDDIWRALEHAHLKAFVNDLGTGLQYEVTEGGENLSVGQRQLVCLARALLRKTPLLVLDEATAAVDLETDELIQKTIRSEFASCTVLTIAHRLNTILDCTKVMVLDKGQLVEYAQPDELLRDHSSLFYSMAKDAGLVD